MKSYTYNIDTKLSIKLPEKKYIVADNIKEIYKNKFIKCNQELQEKNNKCGSKYICNTNRFCNQNGQCVEYQNKDDYSKTNPYRRCNHPNDVNCIPSSSCYSNDICSVLYHH